ncbi:MAG: hypothetical protein ACLP6G_01695 [Terriglobales bacterium]
MVSQRQSRERARELWQSLQKLTPLSSQPGSNGELGEIAVRGQAANAVLLAFTRDFTAPLNAPEFSSHLENYRQDGSRDLARNGYRLRVAEREVMGNRALMPLGQVEEILRSGTTPREMTAAIAEYLDTHSTVGLGDPVRLYVLAPFDDVRDAFDCLVEQAVEANRLYISDLEMQTELYQRYVAYGYVYKVAEDLVRRGLPEDWKPNDADVAEPDGDEAKPKLIPLWAYFYGKHNSAPVLYEKAKVITSLIDTVWTDELILATPIRAQDRNSWVRLDEAQVRGIIAETAALFIRIVDEIAFSALSDESSIELTEALIEFVGRDLQGRGVQPAAFAELLKERLTEYAGYPKWVFGKGESAKGTLFWEFGKKVASVLGIGKSTVFQMILANVLLRSLADWRLAELLRGVEEDDKAGVT